MVRRIGCPVCSRPGVDYLMIRETRRDFDDELMMPITIFRHGTCKTKMRVTGVVCMDCGGTGDYLEKTKIVRGGMIEIMKISKNCPHCNGWGIIPRKFEIIPGNGPRPAGSRVFDYFNPPPYDATNMMENTTEKVRRRDRLFSRLFKDDRSG